MKRLSILILLLATVLLSGCVSSKQVEEDNLNRELVYYRLTNDCAWQLDVTIIQKGLPSSRQSFVLGKSLEVVQLYKDADYIISIKGTYDISSHTFNIQTDERNVWFFDWDGYDGKYHLKRGKSVF